MLPPRNRLRLSLAPNASYNLNAAAIEALLQSSADGADFVSAAVKDAAGKFIHEAVWRYLFNQPVEDVGPAVPADPKCRKDLAAPVKKAK